MSTSTKNAKQCFEHNQQRAANDPERHDLYAGLYSLTIAVEQLQDELNALRHELHQLQHK